MTEVHALGAASMQIGICSLFSLWGGDSTGEIEQYVLQSFRIAAANILKEFDKEKIFLFFLKKKNKIIYSIKEFLDDSKLQ